MITFETQGAAAGSAKRGQKEPGEKRPVTPEILQAEPVEYARPRLSEAEADSLVASLARMVSEDPEQAIESHSGLEAETVFRHLDGISSSL